MCPDKDLLSTFVDGEVPSPWNEQIKNHIDSCSNCQKIVEQYRFISSNLLTEVPSCTQEFLDKSFERLLGKMQTRHSTAISNYTFKNNLHHQFSVKSIAAVAAFLLFVPAAFFVGKSLGKTNFPMQQFFSSANNTVGNFPQQVRFPGVQNSNSPITGINVLSGSNSLSMINSAGTSNTNNGTIVPVVGTAGDLFSSHGAFYSDGKTIVIRLPNLVNFAVSGEEGMLGNILIMDQSFSDNTNTENK